MGRWDLKTFALEYFCMGVQYWPIHCSILRQPSTFSGQNSTPIERLIVRRLWSNKVPMRSGARWAWRTCLRTGPAVWQLGCVTAEPSPIEFNRSEHVNMKLGQLQCHRNLFSSWGDSYPYSVGTTSTSISQHFQLTVDPFKKNGDIFC